MGNNWEMRFKKEVLIQAFANVISINKRFLYQIEVGINIYIIHGLKPLDKRRKKLEKICFRILIIFIKYFVIREKGILKEFHTTKNAFS